MQIRGTTITVVILTAVALLLVAGSAAGQATHSGPEPAQTTVTLTPVADAGIESGAPDTNFGHAATLPVYYGGQNEIGRAPIRFNPAAGVPPEAIIDSARLDVFLQYGEGANPVNLVAGLVTQDWSESGVTWNTQPATSEPFLATLVDTSSDYKGLDVTDIVRAWHNVPYHGLELWGPEGETQYGRTFESREGGENPPRLVVTYHLPAPEVYTFAGHVYQGSPPDTSTPIGGVTVGLWGDDNEWPEDGRVFLTETTTGEAGEFTLNWEVGEPFAYYHIIEEDPPGTFSTGAQVEPPGYVKNYNVVSYLDIPPGTYSGSAFWDQPLAAGTPTPTATGTPTRTPTPTSTRVTDTPTLSPTPTGTLPPGCIELLVNGDFETGDLPPWGRDGAVGLGPGRNSDYGAWQGGADNAGGELWQVVNIPPGANPVRLEFWWLADAEIEQPDDILDVIVQYGEEQADHLRTLRAETPLGQWRQEAVDLTAYAGQEVAVTFQVHTDGEVPSTFRLDDISLKACGVGTPMPTLTPTATEAATLTPTVTPTSTTSQPNPKRQAGQLLENMRGSDFAPGWDRARLGPTARPLYRPDVEGIAYYEYQVMAESEPAGFIIVATGDHDFPMPHWNFIGESPTQELERKARDAGKTAVRFYKLDALAYAAEDAQGNLVATVGTELVKVTGLDPAWLDQPVELTESIWTPNEETVDDTNPPTGGQLRVTGPVSSTLQLGAWESWEQLKTEYADSYGVLLEGLHREAVEEWEIERLSTRYGEGLTKGDTYTLALLCTETQTPTITLSGAGVPYIETELVTRDGLPPAYRITVLESSPGEDLPLDVMIDCSGGVREVVKFMIVEPPATVYLPLARRGGSPETGPVYRTQSIPRLQGSWAAYWAWAGTNDQRMYNQIAFYPPPTISSCPSGCGATAWAMLFGWADYQAGSLFWNYWRPRWGIYRQNGGYGANARAPAYMDAGVRNMTWEIRADIATWCAFGSAPTFPWDMDQASYYLKGRTGTRLVTHYNVFGISESRLRVYARDSILHRKTPAIIGTGWLNHYPLAYGYQWWSRRVKKCFIWCWYTTQYNRQFWVNQGWGGSGNGWIPARTWFAGEIYP